MSGFTAVPNEVLDHMAKLSPAEFKVTMAIYRLIIGYKKYRLTGRRVISIGDLQKATDLSRQGVINTFDKIIEMGFLSKETEGKVTTWIVNSVAMQVNSVDQSGDELVNSVDHDSQLNVPDSVNSVDHDGGDSLYKNKKQNNNTPPNPPEDEIELEIPEPFKPKYSRLIPPALQNNQFLSIWATYEEYHASSPKPLTEFTAKRQLEKMGKWGLDRAISAMNHSMDNNYTGLVEPKPEYTNGHHPSGPNIDDIVKSAFQDDAIRR